MVTSHRHALRDRWNVRPARVDAAARRFIHAPRRSQPHVTLHGGHFLQEDCGEALAHTVVDVVRATPP